MYKEFKQVEEDLRTFDEEHGEEQDRQMAESQRQEANFGKRSRGSIR